MPNGHLCKYFGPHANITFGSQEEEINSIWTEICIHLGRVLRKILIALCDEASSKSRGKILVIIIIIKKKKKFSLKTIMGNKFQKLHLFYFFY